MFSWYLDFPNFNSILFCGMGANQMKYEGSDCHLENTWWEWHKILHNHVSLNPLELMRYWVRNAPLIFEIKFWVTFDTTLCGEILGFMMFRIYWQNGFKFGIGNGRYNGYLLQFMTLISSILEGQIAMWVGGMIELLPVIYEKMCCCYWCRIIPHWP